MAQGKIKLIIQGVDDFSKTLNGMTKKLNAVGSLANKIGVGLGVGLTAPIVGFGIASMKASMNFNKLMANVGSLIPNNISRVNELKDSVLKLSNETGVSTELISKGLYDMISAFGDSAESAKIMEINVKASTAGLATMQDAIALTSAVTKGYNDTSAKAVEKASDLAFMTVRLGQTTFPELAQSIGRVTPLANALGVSQEELFGIFATATGVTGKATDVSTQFRGTLQALLAPSKKMKDLMKSLGFANGEAMMKQLGMKGSLDMIVSTAKKANLPLQELIGSIEGQTLALALTGNSAQDFTNKLGEMKKAQGSMKQAFKDQTEGVNKAGHGFEVLMTKLTNFASRVGDILSPVFISLLDSVSPLLDTLQDMSPTILKVAVGFGAVLASIAPVLLMVGQLISAISAVSGAFATLGGMSGIIAILSNPIGWIVGAVMLLAGAVTFVVNNWESKWSKLIMFIFPIVGLVSLIIRNWSKLVPFFKFVFLPLILIFKGLWALGSWLFPKLADVAMVAFKPIEDFINFVFESLAKIADLVLPDWVKEQIGLSTEANTTNKQIIENKSKNQKNQSSFNGTMTFANAPKGSSLNIAENSSNLDVGFENGYIFAP